jgi:multidrug resistance protein MdtO
MITYLLYTGLDWPGIRTCLITCFFVALGSVGETVHKLSLRLSGALVGGLLGGLCIVYVIPHMTDIGDLALLICAAAALFAWVSTSSEMLAYAGMQMALAFFLGVLDGYGPATDLKVLRDRLIGIVLGNVVMSVVFSTVWPVSAREQARRGLAGALRALSRLLRSDPQHLVAGSYLGVETAIDRAKHLAGMGTFEAPLLPQTAHLTVEQHRIDAIAEIARAAFVVVNQPAIAGSAAPPRCDDVADWLADSAAPWVESGAAGAPAVALAPQPEPTILPGMSPYLRAALQARAALRLKIASFIAYAA